MSEQKEQTQQIEDQEKPLIPYEAIAKALETYMDAINLAFEDKPFDVYSLSEYFNCSIDESKGIIEFLLNSGLVIKEPKKNKYLNRIYQVGEDFAKLMTELDENVKQKESDLLIANIGCAIIVSGYEQAKQIATQKTQDHGKEETQE